MALEVLEGTWEEIAQHAAEFSGKRVRLTVIEPQAQPPTVAERPRSEALPSFIGAIDSREPWEPRKRSKPDAFGEGVIEKFRKQGLVLPEQNHDTD